PPTLLVNSADEVVPVDQPLAYAQRLDEAGVPHAVRVLPGTQHGRAYAAQVMPEAIGFLSVWLAPGGPAQRPVLLFSGASQPGDVELGWTDASTQESGYVVERRDESHPFAAVSPQLAADTTFWSDATAQAGATYTYRVDRLGVRLQGDTSNEVTVAVGTGGPAATP